LNISAPTAVAAKTTAAKMAMAVEEKIHKQRARFGNQ